MGGKPFIDNFTNNHFDGLVEGTRIRVISAGGLNDTGVFIRIDNNFLVWVRDDGATPDLTFTSLLGISISRL